MKHAGWNRTARSTILLAVLALAAVAPAAWATIPDANIREGVNRGGFGMISGAYGQADFSLSERSAVGGYFGIDHNDIYFADYGRWDDTFDDDVVVGGHYMYQFLEGTASEPSISGVFGAFANRGGLRPEFGFALSYPFDAKWTGRANVVYGPSWGFEFGYRFSPSVEGTFGITGMGVVGLGFRF
jgi:opacity protein-like surface antigen